MGYRHSHEQILEAAIAVAREHGMAALTFARVGERLGISDRTVVYYFETKSALVLAVAEALGANLLVLLDQAFGTSACSQHELLQRAWPTLTTGDADVAFSLYFEMLGLASAGQSPYDVIATAMVGGWVEWLTPRTLGSTAAIRRRRALAIVAQIDGLLLVRRMLGADAADDAARELGIR